MKRVHFLIDRSRIVDYLTAPVRANRARLRKRGYDVRFFHAARPKALSCDILALVSKAVLTLVQEPRPVIAEDSPTLELLRKARDHAGKVIWFDSSDSTGVTHFELLPEVDLYLKKHLLKDRSRYCKPMHGGRIFSDYYHREFGIEDATPFEQFHPLHAQHESKVHLSWNMGLGELYDCFSWWGRARRVSPDLIPPRLSARFFTPYDERPDDLFLRASANWSRDTVAFHRKELTRRLETLIDVHGLAGSVSRRTGEKYLSLREYRRRIQQAKITFGPFGWGELNLREYEALMFGAFLMRPDSSHMETWPDIFRDQETCVFYRWDFSDLEEKVLHYLARDGERRQIAAAGQDAYRDVLSLSGMERFSAWFVQQIEL